MKIFIPKEGMLPDSYFPEKKTLIFQKKKTANVFLLKFFSLDFCVCAGDPTRRGGNHGEN